MKNENSKIELLVNLRAKKKTLENEIKALENDFKNDDENVFNSDIHTLKIISVDTNRIDYKAISIKLKCSDYMLKKYSKESSYNKILITVKTK